MPVERRTKAAGALMAATIAAVLVFVQGCEGTDKPARQVPADGYLLLHSVPPFLSHEPEFHRDIGIIGVVTHSPITSADPTLRLDEYPVAVVLNDIPHRPLEWRLGTDAADQLSYFAVLKCAALTIDASVTWQQFDSRERVATQLATIKNELDSRCLDFEREQDRQPSKTRQ